MRLEETVRIRLNEAIERSKASGKTVRTVCNNAGIDESQLNRIRKGKAGLPLDRVEPICAALAIEPRWLFGFESSQSGTPTMPPQDVAALRVGRRFQELPFDLRRRVAIIAFALMEEERGSRVRGIPELMPQDSGRTKGKPNTKSRPAPSAK